MKQQLNILTFEPIPKMYKILLQFKVSAGLLLRVLRKYGLPLQKQLKKLDAFKELYTVSVICVYRFSIAEQSLTNYMASYIFMYLSALSIHRNQNCKNQFNSLQLEQG